MLKLSKLFASVLAVLLVFTTFIGPVGTYSKAHAADESKLVTDLKNIYANISDKSAITAARQKLQTVNWNGIIPQVMVDKVAALNLNGVTAQGIVNDVVGIFLDTDEKFQQNIDNFQLKYKDAFDALFGTDITVDLMVDFLGAVEIELANITIKNFISGNTKKAFDELVKQAVNNVIAGVNSGGIFGNYQDKPQFRTFDNKLSTGLGVGINDLIDLKRKIDAEIDPQNTARNAFIQGVATWKGANIKVNESSPNTITLDLRSGNTISFKYEVVYSGIPANISNKVNWVLDKSANPAMNVTLTPDDGNNVAILTANSIGTVTVRAVVFDNVVLDSVSVNVINTAGSGGGGTTPPPQPPPQPPVEPPVEPPVNDDDPPQKEIEIKPGEPVKVELTEAEKEKAKEAGLVVKSEVIEIKIPAEVIRALGDDLQLELELATDIAEIADLADVAEEAAAIEGGIQGEIVVLKISGASGVTFDKPVQIEVKVKDGASEKVKLVKMTEIGGKLAGLFKGGKVVDGKVVGATNRFSVYTAAETPAAPEPEQEPGEYEDSVEVAFSTETDGAEIYYTTDESLVEFVDTGDEELSYYGFADDNPRLELWSKYDEPIELTEDTVLYVFAKKGPMYGEVKKYEYTIVEMPDDIAENSLAYYLEHEDELLELLTTNSYEQIVVTAGDESYSFADLMEDFDTFIGLLNKYPYEDIKIFTQPVQQGHTLEYYLENQEELEELLLTYPFEDIELVAEDQSYTLEDLMENEETLQELLLTYPFAEIELRVAE